MSTHWMLRTFGDPLAAVRRLLSDLWVAAGLDGMILSVYQTESRGVVLKLLKDPTQLVVADPFIPAVRLNAAKLVFQLAQTQPQARYGAVLRPCETRAVKNLAIRKGLDLGSWLIIGVDCLGSFPVSELEWRMQKAGGVEQLSRRALRFARQGGIAVYRYRRACQMCVPPNRTDLDIYIGLVGLTIKEAILVTIGNNDLADRLVLETQALYPATEALIAQHEKALRALSARRSRIRQEELRALDDSLPGDLLSLVDHLKNCAPCQKCLEACPVYAGELVSLDNSRIDQIKDWLARCAGCGMCEEVCPERFPLAAVIARINYKLDRMSERTYLSMR